MANDLIAMMPCFCPLVAVFVILLLPCWKTVALPLIVHGAAARLHQDAERLGQAHPILIGSMQYLGVAHVSSPMSPILVFKCLADAIATK